MLGNFFIIRLRLDIIQNIIASFKILLILKSEIFSHLEIFTIHFYILVDFIFRGLNMKYFDRLYKMIKENFTAFFGIKKFIDNKIAFGMIGQILDQFINFLNFI